MNYLIRVGTLMFIVVLIMKERLVEERARVEGLVQELVVE